MRLHGTIVHRLRGRLRVRIEECRGDFECFGRLRDGLASCPEVDRVVTNATTGSVLIYHQGESDDVVAFARQRGLFELAAEPELRRSQLFRIRSAVATADAELRRRTRGEFNIASATVYALLAGAAYQAVRGNVLPAAAAMFTHALTLTFDAAATEHASAGTEMG